MNSRTLSQLSNNTQVKAVDSAKWLLSHGISSATTEELAALLAIPGSHVPQRMAALKRRKEIVSPARGLWIPVPPEYASWGAPPAIEMIDAIMRHLRVSYYIGWLSAAELHGASHHAPQVFQVAVSDTVRGRTTGRARFIFYHREHIQKVSLVQVETRSGMVPVSSVETTLLDIACDLVIAGGVDNAANIVIELCEEKCPDMASLAALSWQYPATASRRLGHLMQNYTEVKGLDTLKAACARRNTALSLLDPQAGFNGPVDQDWYIRINREVSPDV